MKEERTALQNQLALEAKKGTEGAMERLFNTLEPVIKWLVYKYATFFNEALYSYEDAAQDCRMAALIAVRKWVPEKGPFVQYFVQWGRGALLRQAKKQGAIKIPEYLLKQLLAEDVALEEDNKVVEPVKKKSKYLASAREVRSSVSLESLLENDTNDRGVYDAAAIEPEKAFFAKNSLHLSDEVEELFNLLPLSVQEVLIHTYGLDGNSPMNLSETMAACARKHASSISRTRTAGIDTLRRLILERKDELAPSIRKRAEAYLAQQAEA